MQSPRGSNHGLSSLWLAGALAAGLIGPAIAQSVGWVPIRPVSIELRDIKSGYMTAADDARGVIVSFGCLAPQSGIADTWEWGGSQWTPRDPARLPAWRQDSLFAHDPVRGRTVMFAGTLASNLTNETWEWDGEVWTQRSLAVSPGPRSGCRGVYDRARGRIVLFGGFRAGPSFADTWEFDGSSWIQRFPLHAPAGRGWHGMVYDEQRQRVVLHGGTVGGVSNGETWEWDGTDWSFAAFGPVLTEPTMLWDRLRNRTVLAGYVQFTGPGTYEWNGSGWTQASINLPFPHGSTQVGATDPTLGCAVVFADGARWQWNGASWQATAGTHPTPRGRFPAPYCVDTARNRIVLYSNTQGTWEWNGADWALGPYGPGHIYAAMAFDAARGVSVLFGGQTANLVFSNATFEWNGATWTQRSPANQPSPRTFHAMAYDAARQNVVLFGGAGPLGPFSQPGPIFGDTWTYDGTNWTQRIGGPSARASHRMVYDPVRQVVVMVGGGDNVGPAAPTVWEWNGTTWTQRTPAVVPPFRSAAALAFDPTRNAVVMFGGLDTAVRNDTWTWNGTTWTQIATTPDAPARHSAGLAFDPVRQQLLLFGGITPDTPFALSCCERADMAVLQTAPSLPATATVGTGCAAGTAPRLDSSLPYLGNSDFALELLGAAPTTLGAIGVDFSLLAQPLGACTLWLPPTAVLLPALTNGFGATRIALPLPNAPSLVGLLLVAQGAVLATPGGIAGLDLTAARTMQIGH